MQTQRKLFNTLEVARVYAQAVADYNLIPVGVLPLFGKWLVCDYNSYYRYDTGNVRHPGADAVQAAKRPLETYPWWNNARS